MSYSASDIDRIKLIVGMEVHVELATRTKMFSRAPSPACPEFDPHDNPSVTPNTLIDATVLALPGALPVMNKAAVDMAIKVGLALNCQIAPITKWDRKSYFYPDLPKAYQISQYDLPICFDGSIDVPAVDKLGISRTAASTDASSYQRVWRHIREWLDSQFAGRTVFVQLRGLLRYRRLITPHWQLSMHFLSRARGGEPNCCRFRPQSFLSRKFRK